MGKLSFFDTGIAKRAKDLPTEDKRHKSPKLSKTQNINWGNKIGETNYIFNILSVLIMSKLFLTKVTRNLKMYYLCTFMLPMAYYNKILILQHCSSSFLQDIITLQNN